MSVPLKQSSSDEEPIPQRPDRVESGRWVFLATSFTGPIQLGTSVLLARLLQPAGFGMYGLLSSTAVSLCGIAGFGLDVALNRYSAENYRRNTPLGRRLVSNIVSASFLAGSLFFVLAASSAPLWISRVFPAVMPMRAIVICVILGWTSFLVTNAINLLNGLQLFRALSTMKIMQTGLTLIAGALFGNFWGVTGAIFGVLTASVMCLLYSGYQLWAFDHELFRWRPHYHHGDALEIAHFAFPLWLGPFAAGPLVTLSLSLLSQQPGGIQELGIFRTASGLRILLNVLPGILATVMSPAIMEEGGRSGRPEQFNKLLQDTVVATSFLTLPMVILLIGARSWLFMLYGHAYVEASSYFIWLVLAASLSLITSPVHISMVARKVIWPLQVIGITEAALTLLLAYLWVPMYKGMGLVFAMLLAELISDICTHEFCIRKGVVPSNLRKSFYQKVGVLAVIGIVTSTIPLIWSQIIAIPVSLGLAYLILCRHVSVADWITRAAPSIVRPLVRKCLTMLVGVPAQ